MHEIYRDWRRVLDGLRPADRILCAEAWVDPADAPRPLRAPGRDAPGVQLRLPRRPLGRHRPCARSSTRSLRGHRRGRRPDHLGAVQPRRGPARHPAGSGPAGSRRPNGIGADDPQPDAALGLRRARAATLLMLALPGSAYLYQGEELGLPEDTHAARRGPPGPDLGPHRAAQQRGRDGCRVPIPWAGGRAGVRLRAGRRPLAAAARRLRRPRRRPAGRRRRLDARAVPGAARVPPRAPVRARQPDLGRAVVRHRHRPAQHRRRRRAHPARGDQPRRRPGGPAGRRGARRLAPR